MVSRQRKFPAYSIDTCTLDFKWMNNEKDMVAIADPGERPAGPRNFCRVFVYVLSIAYGLRVLTSKTNVQVTIDSK